MKKLISISMVGAALLIWIYVYDQTDPNAKLKVLFGYGTPITKLIKSGNADLCAIAIEKISAISPEDKELLISFFVEELKSGPIEVKRQEKIGSPFDFAYNEDPTTVGDCFLSGLAALEPLPKIFISLLSRSDNFTSYDSSLVNKILVGLIKNNPEDIRYFTSYLKNTANVGGTRVVQLYENLGEIGIRSLIDELTTQLDSVTKENAELVYKNIEPFFRLIDLYLISSKGKPYWQELGSLVLHPKFPMGHKGPFVSGLNYAYGTSTPGDVLRAADGDNKTNRQGLSARQSYESLEDETMADLLKNSWGWKSPRDFSGENRRLFEKYFSEVMADINSRNLKLNKIYSKNSRLKKISMGYLGTKVLYYVPYEMKFIIESPYFPKRLKHQFSSFVKTNAQTESRDPFDKFIASQYLILTNGLSQGNALALSKARKRFYEKNTFVRLNMYRKVLNLLVNKADLDLPLHQKNFARWIEKNRSSRVTYSGYGEGPAGHALLRYLEFLRNSEYGDIFRAYQLYKDNEDGEAWRLIKYFASGDEQKLYEYVALHSGCDQLSYVGVFYLLPENNRDSLIEKMVRCPLKFLNERVKWRVLTKPEILEALLESEQNEEKKILLLKLYEKSHDVNF